MNIRQATVNDLLQMQTTNLWCLPENYQVRKSLYCKIMQFSLSALIYVHFLFDLFSSLDR